MACLLAQTTAIINKLNQVKLLNNTICAVATTEKPQLAIRDQSHQNLRPTIDDGYNAETVQTNTPRTEDRYKANFRCNQQLYVNKASVAIQTFYT